MAKKTGRSEVIDEHRSCGAFCVFDVTQRHNRYSSRLMTQNLTNATSPAQRLNQNRKSKSVKCIGTILFLLATVSLP